MALVWVPEPGKLRHEVDLWQKWELWSRFWHGHLDYGLENTTWLRVSKHWENPVFKQSKLVYSLEEEK